MSDLVMAVLIAAAFALFYGFLAWCGRVVDEGGERG